MRKASGITVRVFDADDAMQYALAYDKDGTGYVICSEGVGWSLFNYLQGADKDDLLKQAQDEGTDIDLADFIRQFGARLESNYALWRARLSK